LNNLYRRSLFSFKQNLLAQEQSLAKQAFNYFNTLKVPPLKNDTCLVTEGFDRNNWQTLCE
jgi:hypothetical protein